MWKVFLGRVRMGRQALGPIGGRVVSYWVETEVELEEEVEVQCHLWL